MRTYLVAAAIAATLMAGTAEAQKPGSVYLEVSAEDWAQCKSEGGCKLYSEDNLRELVQQAAALAIQRARLQCGRGT
jgi:hypothetical protein